VSLPLQDPDDLTAVTLLLRLSYLYRRLLRTRDPAALQRIRIEVAQHALPDALDALYETMLAKRGADVSMPGPVE
jgi:hypothetical protein